MSDRNQSWFDKPNETFNHSGDEDERFKRCLDEFNKRFPSELECVLALEIVLALSMTCRSCHFKNPASGTGKREYICCNCNTKNWLTSGTFFERVRMLRPWFAAIWIMEHGFTVSASRFHVVFAIAYQTAWNIFRKLTRVIEIESERHSVEGPSLLFIELMGRRSRETPARVHPSSEESEYSNEPKSQSSDRGTTANRANNDHVVNSVIIEDITESTAHKAGGPMPLIEMNPSEIKTRTNRTDENRLSNEEEFVLSVIPGGETNFDELQRLTDLPPGQLTSLLTVLELAGKVTSLSSWTYKRNDEQREESKYLSLPIQVSAGASRNGDISVSSIIEYVKCHFHRISRKYLQTYLAAYWCHVDRAFWHSGSLFTACLRSKSISDEEVLEYVSPRMVKIWAV